MSHYVYTCACCGTQWDRTSTGRYPTPKELAGMVCQPCKEASKRITELEAEAQRWREAHDKIIAYAADVEAKAKESIAEVAAENAALREDKARLDWYEECIYGGPQQIYVAHLRAYRWHWMGNNYDTFRKAIDAARKESR